MTSGALISDCTRYRYRLWRTVKDGAPGTVVFVLLNPSTADESVDDPTIRRCLGFAERGGFGRLVVVNLFALRATDPRELLRAEDPVGPANDSEIVLAVREADRVVAAWGAPETTLTRKRAAHILFLLQKHSSVYALALSKEGHPRHPLYLPNAAEMFMFQAQL